MAEIIATNAYRTELATRAASGAASLVPYKMAFGDGDSLESPDDIALENELFRVDLDSVSADGMTLTVAASVGWTDTGGYPICEVGVFAQNGAGEVLMGRKVFPSKDFVDPDWSEFILSFTY